VSIFLCLIKEQRVTTDRGEGDTDRETKEREGAGKNHLRNERLSLNLVHTTGPREIKKESVVKL
jgi:hypothetical protein